MRLTGALLIRSIVLVTTALVGATLSPALAQPAWPTRPVRIVTGTPAGGSPDIISRLIGDRLAERLGQAIVVENSSTVGVPAWAGVAKSPPDGYLYSMLTGAFSARAAVAKSLPYDAIKDFTFVTMVSSYPMVVATAPGSPIRSFADALALARTRTVTVGTNLPGSVHHLTCELINVEAGVAMQAIPYRGNSQILQDLLGGRLDLMIETGTAALGQIQSGTLRGLAVTSRERFALAPGLPPVADAIPGFEVISWLGLAGPAGIPRPVVARFNREVADVLALPEVREKLAAVGNVPTPSSPEAMRDDIARDIARWNRVVELKKIERY
jgi:tripartite-type tricarboxylate transporter receptor subunit TctC